jgi:hypothetical protein
MIGTGLAKVFILLGSKQGNTGMPMGFKHEATRRTDDRLGFDKLLTTRTNWHRTSNRSFLNPSLLHYRPRP